MNRSRGRLGFIEFAVKPRGPILSRNGLVLRRSRRNREKEELPKS
jgi:hypothetical protein